MCSKNWIISIIAALTMQFGLVALVVAHEVETENIAGTGGEFTLDSQEGPVSLEALRGKLVLLFFGYTACVDVCPMTLWSLAKTFSSLTPEELAQVTALFISLDPERDTPDMLHKYTGYFHSNITGVTADMDVLNQLIFDYGVSYEKKVEPDSAVGYVIYHTPDILVVDAEGHLLDVRIPVSASSEDIASRIREILGSNS